MRSKESIWYTYVSFDPFGRLYIGYRKCPADKTPETDPYLESYTDVSFKPIGKAILEVYSSREEALQNEIELHRVNNVAKNPIFANKSRATSTGFYFDSTGKTCSEDARKKMSKTRKGKTKSKQHRKRISIALSGENNPMYGKKHTEENKRKISEALLGEKNHMTGKKHTDSSKRKMSESQRKINRRGEKSPFYKPRDWFHPVHGAILQKSLTDLINMFPEKRLFSSALSLVANHKLFHYKGWRLLENKNSSKRHKGNISRDWHHPVHGQVLQKSCAELAKMFPDQKLKRSCLSQVANLKSNQHKGWTCTA
jgi:hypothetical protein